jgi:hypothetical protein
MIVVTPRTPLRMATTLQTEEPRQWLLALCKPPSCRRRHQRSDAHARWRQMAERLRRSRAARGRLEWSICWEKHGQDVSWTARHCGISRTTFYKGAVRLDQAVLRGLEDASRPPRRRRRRPYTARQYERGVIRRRQHRRDGNTKLLALYRRRHAADHRLSAGKMQGLMQASGLYDAPAKQARINRQRRVARTRKQIPERKRTPVAGVLLGVDTGVRELARPEAVSPHRDRPAHQGGLCQDVDDAQLGVCPGFSPPPV